VHEVGLIEIVRSPRSEAACPGRAASSAAVHGRCVRRQAICPWAAQTFAICFILVRSAEPTEWR
jgi:hypothetical protein